MTTSSRRRFLLSLLALSAASGGGLALYNARRRRDPAGVVAEVVRRRLSHLDLDPGDLGRFADDYLARAGPGKLKKLEVLADGERSLALQQFEREIVAAFLLGSDFFDRPGEPEAASYVAFPDPYELGCANPLARAANVRERPRDV